MGLVEALRLLHVVDFEDVPGADEVILAGPDGDVLAGPWVAGAIQLATDEDVLVELPVGGVQVPLAQRRPLGEEVRGPTGALCDSDRLYFPRRLHVHGAQGPKPGARADGDVRQEPNFVDSEAMAHQFEFRLRQQALREGTHEVRIGGGQDYAGVRELETVPSYPALDGQ